MESIELKEDKFEFDKRWDMDSYFDEVIGENLEEDFDCQEVRLTGLRPSKKLY